MVQELLHVCTSSSLLSLSVAGCAAALTLSLLCVSSSDVSGPMPSSYSPTYVEAAWYPWWEKSVSPWVWGGWVYHACDSLVKVFDLEHTSE